MTDTTTLDDASSGIQTDEDGSVGAATTGDTGLAGLQQAQLVVADEPDILEPIAKPPATMHGLPGTEDGSGPGSYMLLVNRGALVRVQRCRGEHPDCEVGRRDCDVNVWRANPRMYRALLEYRESLDLLECGHAPFRNVRGESAPGYSCVEDDCDARYTREQVEAVIGDV